MYDGCTNFHEKQTKAWKYILEVDDEDKLNQST